VTTKLSSRSVSDTAARLIEVLESKGVKVFAVIDHSGEAAKAGLELRDTALDLPLKVLVWADGGMLAAIDAVADAAIASA
jgi:uncharacterized protein (DUF302 family)